MAKSACIPDYLAAWRTWDLTAACPTHALHYASVSADVRTLVNEAPKQVDLPSMRQQINAVDSSVDVGISIPASYPAMSSPSIDTAPAHANRVQQPELNQTSAPCLKAEHHVKFPSHSHQFDRQQSEGKPITVAMLQSEPPCIDCSGGRGAPFREASTERVIMSVDFATSQVQIAVQMLLTPSC